MSKTVTVITDRGQIVMEFSLWYVDGETTQEIAVWLEQCEDALAQRLDGFEVAVFP